MATSAPLPPPSAARKRRKWIWWILRWRGRPLSRRARLRIALALAIWVILFAADMWFLFSAPTQTGSARPQATVTIRVPAPRATVTASVPAPGPTVTVLASGPDSGGVLTELSQVGGFLLGVGTCIAGMAAWWALRRRKQDQDGDPAVS